MIFMRAIDMRRVQQRSEADGSTGTRGQLLSKRRRPAAVDERRPILVVRQRRKTTAKRDHLFVAEIRLDVRTVEAGHPAAVPACILADASDGTLTRAEIANDRDDQVLLV